LIPLQLKKAIQEKNCILFAGAGFSLEGQLPEGNRLPAGRGLGYLLAQELHAAEYLHAPHAPPKEDQPFNLAELAEDYETAFGRYALMVSEKYTNIIKLHGDFEAVERIVTRPQGVLCGSWTKN
jgi:hypothetical protein